MIDELKANEIKNIEVEFTEAKELLNDDVLELWIEGTEQYEKVGIRMKMNIDQ